MFKIPGRIHQESEPKREILIPSERSAFTAPTTSFQPPQKRVKLDTQAPDEQLSSEPLMDVTSEERSPSCVVM